MNDNNPGVLSTYIVINMLAIATRKLTMMTFNSDVSPPSMRTARLRGIAERITTAIVMSSGTIDMRLRGMFGYIKFGVSLSIGEIVKLISSTQYSTRQRKR